MSSNGAGRSRWLLCLFSKLQSQLAQNRRVSRARWQWHQGNAKAREPRTSAQLCPKNQVTVNGPMARRTRQMRGSFECAQSPSPRTQ
ncbi:hypothetical protein J3F83DRAFT_752782 [Trichoderma novae-zelandiae]